MKYKIKNAVLKQTRDSDWGKMKDYILELDGVDGGVEISQKEATPAPTTGQEIEGEIEQTKYGAKFRKAKPAGKYDSDGQREGNATSNATLIAIAYKENYKTPEEAAQAVASLRTLILEGYKTERVEKSEQSADLPSRDINEELDQGFLDALARDGQ